MSKFIYKKNFKGGEAMRKEQQAQQTISQAGGEAMNYYFVTFPCKLSSDQAKEIITELKKRFTGQPIFSPRVLPGKRMVININEINVIVTFPFVKTNKQQQPMQEQETSKQEKQDQTKQDQTPQPEGFTLRELIRNKKF
jgi:hypothetical protein